MPRYFFHVLNQRSYTRDEVGAELSGLEAARHRAADVVGEIVTSDLREGRADVVFDVEVDDEAGVRVLTCHIGATMRTGDRG